MPDTENTRSETSVQLEGVRVKPWEPRAAERENLARAARGIQRGRTRLDQAAHRFVAQLFDDAFELLDPRGERFRTLGDIQDRWTLYQVDLPHDWGAYGGGVLYLDRLLLNPENRLELLRTLLFVSGAGSSEGSEAAERYAAEATLAQRPPRPEPREQGVTAAIAAARRGGIDEGMLALLTRTPTRAWETLLNLLAPRLYRNHLLLNDLRRRQLDILPRLARLPGCHFDLARETLGRLFADPQLPSDAGGLATALVGFLLPELTQRVTEALIWDLQLNRQTVETLLPGSPDLETLREVARGLVHDQHGAAAADRFGTIERLIEGWRQGIAVYADDYVRLHSRVDNAQRLASALVAAAADHLRLPDPSAGPLAQALYWLFTRVYQVPHLKRLDQPMLVLLAGISRSGSRFVAKRVAQELSIGTFFTTNQVREAIRSTFRWAYGGEAADELYPELFSSALEPTTDGVEATQADDLTAFHLQSLLTLQGLEGALGRLVKENTSAVIEGVHIIPGLVSEAFYQQANIVTLILGYAETPELLPSAVREAPERIQRRRRLARRINEQVEELAQRGEITVVHDPGRFEATMGEILHRVNDTVADRFTPPDDPLLQRARAALEARGKGICRKTLDTAAASAEAPDSARDDHTLAQLAEQRAILADPSVPEPQRLATARAVARILDRVHAPTALAFDMGGVLVRGHNRIFTRRYAEERLGIQLDDEQLARIHYQVFKVDDAPYRRLTRGAAQPRDFARHLLSEILACRPPDDAPEPGYDDPTAQRAILQGYYDHYEEIADNTRVIGALRGLGIPIYGLTNNFLEKVASIQGRIPLIRDLPMVISEAAQARKPERRIFQYLVRLLQLTEEAERDDLERILFFDDKQKNLDGAFHHFGFYGVNYDANRGERLAETPEIREIMDQTLLRETLRQVTELRAAPHLHGIGEQLDAALAELGERLQGLLRRPPEPQPRQRAEPGEAKTRARLRALGLHERTEQTRLVEFTLGPRSEAFLERHRKRLLRTRQSLVALRTLQFQTLSRMVNVPNGDYDLARRELARVMPYLDEYTSLAEVETRFLRARFGELKWFLADYLGERDLANRPTIERCLEEVDDYAAFKLLQRDGFRALLGPGVEDAETLQRIDIAVAHIEEGVADTARKYRQLWGRWYINQLNEMVALMEDDSVRELVRKLSPHAWHAFVRWLMVRVANIPHIKNLDKPTVVLITGTSGTGKSSVARHIARSLSIPIHFSTDVVGREVVRSTLEFLLGPDTARGELPELYGSSFAPPETWREARADTGGEPLLDWYYGHAMLTMIGVRGILDRLLTTNNSAVIEGVPLVPGLLPEHYFERLNIVWVVATVEDRQTHFTRYAGRDAAGVDRGGAARYRSRFEEIRLIHDRLEQLGRQGGCTVVDNTYGLGETAELALDRIENFFAVRGLPIADPDRERVGADLEARRRRIWSVRLLGREAPAAAD